MLGTEDLEGIRRLTAVVAEADGENPLNEAAVLALGTDDPVVSHHLHHEGGDVVGYAQGNSLHGTAQLFVHPQHRRRGIGTRLLRLIGGLDVWAFGDLPAARGFAAMRGLAERRRLLVLSRPLEPPSGQAHDGVRPFDPATESDELLAVNAVAFDWHPEQRYFSRADLDSRLAEDWFDPAGLLVTSDQHGLTGFHWTRRHEAGRGEVYILAIHPRAQGTGLGKRLLAAGLDHLAATGSTSVYLYVEAANSRAVELYERAGFAVVHSDVLYGPTEPSSQEQR